MYTCLRLFYVCIKIVRVEDRFALLRPDEFDKCRRFLHFVLGRLFIFDLRDRVDDVACELIIDEFQNVKLVLISIGVGVIGRTDFTGGLRNCCQHLGDIALLGDLHAAERLGNFRRCVDGRILHFRQDAEIHKGRARVSADRNGAVGEGDAGCISDIRKARYGCPAVLQRDDDHLVVDDVAACPVDEQSVLFQRIHLLLRGGEEDVTGVPLLDLREKRAGTALSTKTNKVAVVNGMAFPSNVNYQYGFMSGVNYANAKYGTTAECVELPSFAATDLFGNNVGGNYVGDFGDEATGKIVGETLISQGVDVLFVAAGASGNGVFTAAKEAKDVYVIGCDVDQYNDGVNGDSNIILTSGLKVMHSNVTKQLEAIYDGTFTGEDAMLGADTDSTGYVSAEGRQQLSEDALAKLAECYDLLKAGEIATASQWTEYGPTDFPGLN